DLLREIIQIVIGAERPPQHPEHHRREALPQHARRAGIARDQRARQRRVVGVAERCARQQEDPGAVLDVPHHMLLNDGKPHSATEVGPPDIGSSQFYALHRHISARLQSYFFSKNRSTITATKITPPATTFCHSDLPTRFTALKVICMMPAPMSTPNTDP